MSINHYEILGVSPDSDFVQITAAWKRLLKKYHPDINQGDEDANEQTKLVNNAYSVLSDSKRRKKFDKELRRQAGQSKNQSSTLIVANSDQANASTQNPPSDQEQTGDTYFEGESSGKGPFASQNRKKSRQNAYATVLTIAGIVMGAATAIPIGLFMVWIISGFDPLNIFRRTDRFADNVRETPELVDEKLDAAMNKGQTTPPDQTKSDLDKTPKKTEKEASHAAATADSKSTDANSETKAKKPDQQKSKTAESKKDAVQNAPPKTPPQPIIGGTPNPKPLPIPPSNLVASAKQEIAKVFKSEFESAKSKLALEKLQALKKVSEGIHKLAEIEDEAPMLYAIYDVSISIGKQSCYADDTLKIVDEFEKQFAIDALEMRYELFEYWLDRLPTIMRNTVDRKASFSRLSATIQPYVKSASKQKRWELAGRFAEVSRRLMVGSGDRDSGIQMSKTAALMNKLAEDEIIVKRYLQELKADPNQPDKNLAIGTYYCFSLEDWEYGLPFLKTSSNEKLSKVAEMDLRSTVESYVEVGDSWWELKDNVELNAFQNAITSRADLYYRLALPNVTGLTSTKLAKRINEARETRALAVAGPDRPKNWVSPTIGMEFVRIESGKFLLGETSFNIKEFGGHAWEYRHEGPQHEVLISRPFYIGKFEVTQKEWFQVMGTTPWKGFSNTRSGDRVATSMVSWLEAVEFCKRLSKKERKKYRLPTEAEWEYACRAGTQDRYHFGRSNASFSDYGWSRENAWNAKGERFAHPVGLKKPNAWGLYDMHGNVREWCQDVYTREYYGNSPKIAPLNNNADGTNRILRGGSYYQLSFKGRAASRDSAPPNDKRDFSGFRVALED